MRYQVAIIGAGPGGSAAAIRLGQLGVRDVILLDKDRFPREKTCGSALSPGCLRLCGELGIGDEVRRQGYRIDSLRVVTPGQREIHVTADEAVVILLRRHFDNLLVDRAAQLGIEVRQGFKAKQLVRNGGRVVGVSAEDERIDAAFVLCADGAYSIFDWDPRPKRTISTLMGWWEDFPFQAGSVEMFFDKQLLPLYGWLFPETANRVNIGICVDTQDGSAEARAARGLGPKRNLRAVFQTFLDAHFADRIRSARQVGSLKGHPISFTTWIGHCTAPGSLYVGEGARITHNATGEGIYHAMQSGVYAAEAVADAITGRASEEVAWRRYVWRNRAKFTASFAMGWVLRASLYTPLVDGMAIAFNTPTLRRIAASAFGSVLTSTSGRGRAKFVPAEPRSA